MDELELGSNCFILACVLFVSLGLLIFSFYVTSMVEIYYSRLCHVS